jgi:hypothetical protein
VKAKDKEQNSVSESFALFAVNDLLLRLIRIIVPDPSFVGMTGRRGR